MFNPRLNGLLDANIAGGGGGGGDAAPPTYPTLPSSSILALDDTSTVVALPTTIWTASTLTLGQNITAPSLTTNGDGTFNGNVNVTGEVTSVVSSTTDLNVSSTITAGDLTAGFVLGAVDDGQENVVTGNTRIDKAFKVVGTSTFQDNVECQGDLAISGDLSFGGDISITNLHLAYLSTDEAALGGTTSIDQCVIDTLTVVEPIENLGVNSLGAHQMYVDESLQVEGSVDISGDITHSTGALTTTNLTLPNLATMTVDSGAVATFNAPILATAGVQAGGSSTFTSMIVSSTLVAPSITLSTVNGNTANFTDANISGTLTSGSFEPAEITTVDLTVTGNFTHTGPYNPESIHTAGAVVSDVSLSAPVVATPTLQSSVIKTHSSALSVQQEVDSGYIVTLSSLAATQGVYVRNADGMRAGMFTTLNPEMSLNRLMLNLDNASHESGGILIEEASYGQWSLGADVNIPHTIDVGGNSKPFRNYYASGDFIQTSDRRTKRDINDLGNADCEDIVAKTSAKRFKRDADDALHDGFIAQDFEGTPACIHKEDGTLALRYSSLTAYLWNAVRKLQIRVLQLESASRAHPLGDG